MSTPNVSHSSASHSPATFGISTDASTSSTEPTTDTSAVGQPATSNPNPNQPGAAPPPPWQCDDFPCCGNNAVANWCSFHSRQLCPGLPRGLTPPSNIGQLRHPLPNPVITCQDCRRHRHVVNGQTERHWMRAHADENPFSGHKVQLCRDCIEDEMRLYHLRMLLDPPALTNTNRSWQWVHSWPTTGDPRQDLCICAERAVIRWQRHRCHACRSRIWEDVCGEPYGLAERVLHTRRRQVIIGDKTCDLNGGGTVQHRVSDRIIQQRRANLIGRMCPCGNEPKQRRPTSQEYITICLACMGVKVNPRNIPPYYTFLPIMRRWFARKRRHQEVRRSARIAARAAAAVPVPASVTFPGLITKGPTKARTLHIYRVNIERGWVAALQDPDGMLRGDPYVMAPR